MKESDREQNSETTLLQVKNEDLLFGSMGLKIKDEDDRKEVKMILFNLGYPSSELAELHRQCDRVGGHDLIKRNEDGTTVAKKTPNADKVVCPCCGFRKQEEHIPVCTSFDDIPRLGQATDLFFMGIRHTINLMLILSVVYSAFALATNIMASTEACKYYVVCSLTTISQGAKQTTASDVNSNYYMIQSWIGIGLAVLWGLYFMYMSYKERKLEIESDLRTKSASDFSLLIENMPVEMKMEDFQKLLTQNYEAIRSIPALERRAPVIEKYNIAQPFYLSEEDLKDDDLEKLQKDYKHELDEMRGWIKDRIEDQTAEFSVSKAEREKHYETIKSLKEQIVERSKVLKDKIRDEFKKKEENLSTNVVFVTFRNSLTMKMLEKLNSQHLADRFRRFFTSITYNEAIPVKNLKVFRAPEPEDVLWMNLGVPDCEVFWRKLLTFTATFALLGVSFGILYGLSIAQVKETSNIYISVAISVCIQVVNVVIGVVNTQLTIKERNFTLTSYQRSLAMKVIFAQLMNMILVPCIVAYLVKKKVFETGGLIEDVFFLAVTNAFLSPLMRIIDIGYFIKKLLAKYFNRPVPMLKLSQAQLNAKVEGLEFEIGFQYVYAVKTCVFTAFFVSLQPAISFLAVIGLFLTYWSEKYVLFNRSKRPPPGSDIINSTMTQLIYLCPLVFGLGSLTWPVFMPDGTPKSALIPNVITCGISVLLFIIPLETICNCCINSEDRANSDMIYEKERIYFSTEYERRNPATMVEGYKDYLKYLEGIKNKITNAKAGEEGKDMDQMKEQLNNIAMKSMLQNQAGGFAGGNLFFAQGAGYGQQQHQRNNMFNPAMIMQMAAQPPQQFGFQPQMQQPMQQQPIQPPMQQQYNNAPGRMQVFPQPQPQPNPVFVPQPQPRPMQPQFQPQPPAFNFGFNVPQVGFNVQMPQMPSFGFGQQSMSFSMPSQFGGSSFGSLGGFGGFGFM